MSGKCLEIKYNMLQFDLPYIYIYIIEVIIIFDTLFYINGQLIYLLKYNIINNFLL